MNFNPGISQNTPVKWTLNWFLFCFFAAIPSLAMFERFFEVTLGLFPIASSGIFIKIIQGLYLIILWFGAKEIFYRLYALSQSQVNFLFFIFLGMLFLIFSIAYPLIDSGQFGFSSDRDEAIDIAVRQILNGHYPYLCKSVSGVHSGCPTTGNPISPLPGALLLASPFVILGNCALQNFFWIIFFYFALIHHTNSKKIPAIYLVLLGVFSPVLIAEILTGGDYLANSLAVTSATILVLSAISVQGWVLGGILLGISLSWRAHFLLLVIPLVIYHIKYREFQKILITGVAATVSFLLVTLPFFIANPTEFSPIHIQQRLNDFRHILPHANVIVIIITAMIGLALGLWAICHNTLLIACGTTVTTPILIAILLNSVAVEHLTFLFYGWYALAGMTLGTLGTFLRAGNYNTSKIMY